MKDAWALANESLQAYADDLHRQMRMMYGIPPLNVLSPQKLKEAKKEMYTGPLPDDHYCLGCEHPGTVATYSAGGQAAIISQNTAYYVAGRQGWEVSRAHEEKTLLSKPHPESCICPKCPKPDLRITLPVVRIGDAERDRTLEYLREMLAGGYLNPAEFDMRQDLALAAKIQDDLDALVRDLPKPAVKAAVPVADVSGRAAFEPPHHGHDFVLSVLTVASMTTPVIAGAMLSVDASRTGVFVLLAFMVACSLLLAVLRRSP